MSLSLEEARAMAQSGVEFGELYALLAESQREEFKHWWLHEPGIPNLHARAPKQYSGNGCPRCGGALVRDGRCELCPRCGESVGACS